MTMAMKVFLLLVVLPFILFIVWDEDRRRATARKQWEEEQKQYEEDMKTFEGFKKHYAAYSTDDTPEKAWERNKRSD